MLLTNPFIFYDAPGAEGGDSAADQPNPGNSGGNDAPTPANGGGEGRTFTQAELDAILQKRLGRAGETAIGDFLSEIGVEDAETLRSRLQRLSEIEEGQKTEAEKLQERLAALEGANEKAESLQTRVETLETAVSTQLDAVKKRLTIPPYVSALLEGMTAVEQLQYLAEHGEALQRQPAGDDNAGNRSSRKPSDPAQREAELRRRFPALRKQ